MSDKIGEHSPTGYWATYADDPDDSSSEMFFPVIIVRGKACIIEESGEVVPAAESTAFGAFKAVVAFYEG